MKILLLLPLLLGFSVPAVAHNDANGGSEILVNNGGNPIYMPNPNPMLMPLMDEEGEGAETEDEKCFSGECGLGRVSP